MNTSRPSGTGFPARETRVVDPFPRPGKPVPPGRTTSLVPSMRLILATLLLAATANASLAAENAPPPLTAGARQSLVYKTVGPRKLELVVHTPADWRPGDQRPVLLLM